MARMNSAPAAEQWRLCGWDSLLGCHGSERYWADHLAGVRVAGGNQKAGGQPEGGRQWQPCRARG
eukprot:scaffold4847_cov265-Pinguiococcus_pyrenoidosus.AAC.2